MGCLKVCIVSAAVIAVMSGACHGGGEKATKAHSVKGPDSCTTSQLQAGKIQDNEDQSDSLAPNKAASNQQLTVYYFHGNVRCPTCYKLETYARESIEANFGGALSNGKLKWKAVNVEEKGNEHFVNDYRLYTKSVIVSVHGGGKESSWKNLDQIWTLVRDEAGYKTYIKKEIAACLEGKCP
jgi:hypothetical protein